MSSKVIITDLNVAGLKHLQTTMGKRVLIVKLGADWCGPCKRIAPMTYTFYNNCADNILCADIDVDDNLDLYVGLKKYKMVSGIPAFLAFYGDKQREQWYIPDDSVVGADEIQIVNFFARCTAKATGM